jgi:cytochrome c553
VGWVRLDTPLGAVDVFNTHLHANYCHDYRVPPQALRRAAAGAVEALEMGYSGRDASEAAAQAMTVSWQGGREALSEQSRGEGRNARCCCECHDTDTAAGAGARARARLDGQQAAGR